MSSPYLPLLSVLINKEDMPPSLSFGYVYPIIILLFTPIKSKRHCRSKCKQQSTSIHPYQNIHNRHLHLNRPLIIITNITFDIYILGVGDKSHSPPSHFCIPQNSPPYSTQPDHFKSIKQEYFVLS